MKVSIKKDADQVPSKIKEEFPDRNTHRYILRREAFFGNKNVYNVETKKSENQSYFAYRYYFYDRVTRETYPSYYFSGDKWAQLKRLTFWLNQAKG